MEGHDVVAMSQEISGTCAESSWGTCEELLLVSAVKRHGINNWNLISEELNARANSLNVNLLYFSEAVGIKSRVHDNPVGQLLRDFSYDLEYLYYQLFGAQELHYASSSLACKQKYDVLKGRYASSSSSSRSRNEDLVNDMHWFDKLRKLRVAHLKRELEHYDGSIGNLQVKIKRLKAEKAPDASVSTQIGKSIAYSQSNEEVCEGSSCEISVQGPVGEPLEADCNELHSTPVTLGSLRNSRENTSYQTPSNLQEQVLPKGDQWHDGIEDIPYVSPTSTDVKASVSLINNSPFSKSVKGGNDVEQDHGGNSTVLSLAETQFYETPSVQETPADDLQDVETDKVGTSNKDDHPELFMSHSRCQLVDELAHALVKHGAGGIVAHALDNDEVEVGILDLQIGRKLTVKMDVVDEGLGIVHADFGQKGMDRTFVASADSIINMKVSKNGGFDYGETETHPREYTMVLPLLPSSQPLISSGNVGNAEHRHAEPNSVTEVRVNLSKNENGIVELGKTQTVEANYHPILEVGLNKQVHVVLPLDLAKVEPGVQLGMTVSEYPDDVTRTIPSADEVLNFTKKFSPVSEGCRNSNKGVAATILGEVISCEQMQLRLEEFNLKGDDSTVVKELLTLGAENGGLDRYSDGMAMKSASTPKESEKIRISAIIPVASFTNSESGVLRDGAVVFLEKLDPQGSARSSELFNTSDVSKGSPNPERHIVISLDGPGKTTSSSENTFITLANAEDNNSSQLNRPTRSDVNCDTGATGIVEEQHISAQSSSNVDSCEQKDWETPHETPNAMDLLLEVYGTGLENASESVVQTVQAVGCVDVARITPVSISKSKSMEYTSTLAMRVDHDAKMTEETTTDNDKQPCISERSPREDLDVLVQGPRDSRARYGLEVAENVRSVSDQDTLLVSTEEIEVEPGERLDTSEKTDLPIYLGQSSELASSASCAAELEGRQSSDSRMKKFFLTVDPHSSVLAKTFPEVTVIIRQITSDLQDVSYGAESTLPEIIVDMKLEYGKEEISGFDSEAELSSPLEFHAGGLDSKMPSSHEGSDNVQDHYKDGSSGRNREQTQGNRNHVESDVDKSEARSLDVPHEMSPSSRRSHKEPRVPGKLFSLLEVLRNLSNHKSAIFFKGRQEVSELPKHPGPLCRSSKIQSESLADPRYSLLIRRHLDLNFVRTRLDKGAYSSSSEFFRDLLLIFNNGMVYYTRGSVEFRGAKALFMEATKEMNRIFQTEALLKQDRPATRTREVKKPKAFAGVASSGKVVIPSIGAASSAKLADTISPLTSLPDSGSKKRASSRLGIPETPANSLSEGGAPRSASVNVFGDPSSSRAEEAENDQENDQEVNGRLKVRKKSQKGSGGSRGKPHREELLEGILLKNAANKSFGGPKLRDLKEEEALARLPGVLKKGAWGDSLADSESAKKSEAEKEEMRGIEVRGIERDEIDDDDDFLCKGKRLSKLIDLDGTPERGPEVKPFPKSRPTAATRVASKSHGTVSQSVGRPSRGGRKLVTSAQEPVQPSVPQAKKRMRR